MTTAALPGPRRTPRSHRQGGGVGRIALQAFMVLAVVLWLLPLAFAFYVSLRPYSETSLHGYVSWPRHLGLGNFGEAWTQARMGHFLLNSLIIVVPAVIITLVLASFVAFVLARFSFRFNLPMLILFTAGNLLPQQVIITPLYRLYLQIHLPHALSSSGLMYNSLTGLVVVNVSFQLGFCVFVLSNFMKTLPEEIYESALIDGASVWVQFRQLTIPLCRPAMAALATLLTTWIYNDFFWAITLIQTGDKRPITAALANLQGQFVADQNVIAAAALIAATPTLVIYLVLQRQFIAGLALGATKG